MCFVSDLPPSPIDLTLETSPVPGMAPASASGTPKETRKPKAQVVNVFKATCRAALTIGINYSWNSNKKSFTHVTHHHFQIWRNHLRDFRFLEEVTSANIPPKMPNGMKANTSKIWLSMMAHSLLGTSSMHFRMIELIMNLGNHLYYWSFVDPQHCG